MKIRISSWFIAVIILCTVSISARADEITDWNQFMLVAARSATPQTNPLVITRVAAIVQTSVFDAVNGIEEKYTYVHVRPNAPHGASKRAAAVQAAYASLVRLYPSQIATLDLKRTASLAAISSGPAADHSQSIERGIAWGQTVADEIWQWRTGDGSTDVIPPFTGGTAVGQWRPTPPGNSPGGGLQFADMTPWVMNSFAQFRPAGPPALSSTRYAADFNETKIMGKSSSLSRNADQTLFSQFWAASTSTYSFNQIAVSIALKHHLSLSENSRLLALMNIAAADAAIGCFDAKYVFTFWRPVTAIPLAATDGNAATEPDAAWLPLVVTPGHPEYPSGHSCISGALGRVLANFFGDHTSFSVDSDVMLGVVRNFTSFSSALDEIQNARIYGGLHFRSATQDGQTLGIGVADYAMRNFLRPMHGDHDGDDRDHRDRDDRDRDEHDRDRDEGKNRK